MAFTFISCSDENESTENQTPRLQKVIFNVGASNDIQRHWVFNELGLLSQITNGNDLVLQTFSYNSNGKVVNATIHNSNGTNTNLSFTYNLDGSIANLNNSPLNFDNVLNVYYTGDLNSSYTLFKFNNDNLLIYRKSGGVEIDETGTIPYTNSEDYTSYNSNNLAFQSFYNGSFHGFEHDTKVNPLRDATLAAFKAIALTRFNHDWPNSFAISKNNVVRKNYASEYYIHEEYEYVFNSNDLPVSATLHFYKNNNLEFSTLKTLYYYEGDVLP
jgi:hypothetical protein